MAKDRSTTKDGKEKKKEKRSKDAATPLADENSRISKKHKKSKKSKTANPPTDDELDITDATTAVLSVLSASGAAEGAKERTGAAPIGDLVLVPFAKPLAGEKLSKKVFKTAKKAAKNKSLKRGVKEVVKALRKSPTGATATGASSGIVVLAADISPMDVISHIPVLCEDHGIPYVFVRSRAELGAASATKRPTSVAMIVPTVSVGTKDKKKRKGTRDEAMEGAEEAEGGADGFKEAYDGLLALVEEAGRGVMV
ncbi:unnamed protein product [Tuber melanosporum]|jgi:H/ACA ribonucleoprotein complex subunit 2|uniref:H/ACA ribonucleoprotein complex subunit 2 n=1 Tax=Tuber melanosporum (strain Mel28) TaxID=656061 RepID=D5GN76_TUBMM|nr:ribosome biogenesis protein Nhp2 [Tuber melanosporum]CAZ85969.1 unnamed protein product [Tuber melanosporum]